MLFLALLHDRPDGLALRMATRPAHLTFLADNARAIPFGGPILGGPDATPSGSMLILDCPDAAAAQALLAEDPYARAGLFANVSVTPWRQAVGPALV